MKWREMCVTLDRWMDAWDVDAQNGKRLKLSLSEKPEMLFDYY